jgi:serine/threonine-protein kinase
MDRLPDVTTTQTDSLAKRTSSAAHEEGRFVSGTLLGGRYRIIGLLGEGGMGEVYRATDLALGQSVALKFLPETAAGNDRLLERFQNEVRVARQVSHPNVCRMYDIGEVEGAPFLSMEYVDGEDLATLLQRIGRLPADKAIEIARKLCAGLQAAHDKGVIHRDLKPQNIMLNKKGEVLILDFGLAAIAEQIAGAEVRNGTPAYMSPEQLKGTGVTARSDLYSLGLVLYELFTGKRPYAAGTMQELIALQEAAEPSSLTSLASDVDPAVERVVRRCLDPDPLRRPASALAVAAGLPGGDPLAAALAAGETPSPELVAAAGGTDGLAPRYAITCLAVILVCLAGIPWMRQSKVAMLRAAAEFSPEVLAQKARDVTARFGYARKPADRALRLVERKELVEHLRKLPAPEWDRWLAAEGPGVLRYREAQAPLVAEPLGDVTALNPAPVQPGMVQVDLDSGGRLRYFRAVPYGLAEQRAGPPPDVAEVFRAAGLDLSQFAPVELARSPLGVVDQVLAWKGRHPVIPQTELVVQVGSWRGQVTEFRTIWPWMKEGEQAGASWIQRAFEMTGLAMALFFTLLLSRRNWKAGRVDRRGALRLAIVSGGLVVVSWLGSVHPVLATGMVGIVAEIVAQAVFFGAILWLIYLAIEPSVRARWPQSMVTWSRLLAGRWQDSQVWAHVLIGGAAGLALFTAVTGLDAVHFASEGVRPGLWDDYLLGVRPWSGQLSRLLVGSMQSGLFLFLVMCGLRALLRRDWLATLVASALFAAQSGATSSPTDWLAAYLVYFVIFVAAISLLLRMGLVVMIAMVFFFNCMSTLSLGTDWTAWYFSSGIATFLVLVSIALYGFWRALGNQTIFNLPRDSES